jgi:hypothetical protein
MTSIYTYTRMRPTLTDLSAEAIHLIAQHVMTSGTPPPLPSTSSCTPGDQNTHDRTVSEDDADGPFVRSTRFKATSSHGTANIAIDPSLQDYQYPPRAQPQHGPPRHAMTSLDVLMSAASEVSAAASSSSSQSNESYTSRPSNGQGRDQLSVSPSHTSYPRRREAHESDRVKAIDSDLSDYSDHIRTETGFLGGNPQDVYASRTCPDPRSLLPLLLTCKHLHKALRFDDNPELYHWMYMNTFDSEGLLRRWKSYQQGGLNHTYGALSETSGEDAGRKAGIEVKCERHLPKKRRKQITERQGVVADTGTRSTQPSVSAEKGFT